MAEQYELTGFNSKGKNNKKTQIILSETKRNHRDYINALKYRYNGKNPNIPNYVLTKDGVIYKTLEDDEYSNMMGDEDIDKKSVHIVLENYGWLKKNALGGTYVNYIGDIYKKEVFEKKWRDYFFWDKYEDQQIEVLSELILEICNKLNIKKDCLGHNVKFDEIKTFKGVVSKSNFDFTYKDLNPSFNFKLLNELIKNESVR